MRLRFAAFGCALLLVLPCAGAQVHPRNVPEADADSSIQPGRVSPACTYAAVESVEFHGLRRVPAATLRARVTTTPGTRCDAREMQRDVRSLEQLGWFEDVRVALQPAAADADGSPPGTGKSPGVRVIFLLREVPFIHSVQYRDSPHMTARRAEEVVHAAGARLDVASPYVKYEAWRAARALERELARLGYPLARVEWREERLPSLSVRLVLEVTEGPRMPLLAVKFEGNASVPEKELQAQMNHLQPEAWMAGLRGKNIFLPDELRAEIGRVEDFYHRAGFLEARAGTPRILEVEKTEWKLWPWPRRAANHGYSVIVPVVEGPRYSAGEVMLAGFEGRAGERAAALVRKLPAGAPFSAERAREMEAGLRALLQESGGASGMELHSDYTADAGGTNIRARYVARERRIYTVRRIEFRGHHRLSEKFYRNAIRLREGDEFDRERLERGLARIARSGFVNSIAPEDLRVRFDEAAGAVDVTVTVREIGRQRIALTGAVAGARSSAGLAWSAFQLFGGDEFLSTQVEGGPESLSIAYTLIKQGIAGTPLTLGVSLYRTMFRQRLADANGQGPLIITRTLGARARLESAWRPQEWASVSYDLARTTAKLRGSLTDPEQERSLQPLLTPSLRSRVEVAWARETFEQRLDVASSLSGGPLGGSVNSTGASLTYRRWIADPLTQRWNGVSLRGHVAGAGSLGGDVLPLSERLHPAEHLVRGMSESALTPLVLTDSARGPLPQTRGANLIAAATAEFRPLVQGDRELVLFTDAGAGWLMPQWLGAEQPRVAAGTNGRLRLTAGVEVRFAVPLVQEKVRLYYAWNPLNLVEEVALPGGTKLNRILRRGTFGWGLGDFF